MKTVTTTPELLHSTTESNSHLFDDWLDPIETGIRDRVRELIEEMIRSELDAVLSRPRYGRRAGSAEDSDGTAVVTGHRHGRRVRTGSQLAFLASLGVTCGGMSHLPTTSGECWEGTIAHAPLGSDGPCG